MELQDEISQHFRYFRDDRKEQRKFEQSLAGLTPDQENFRPSPDRWTIAENAEHVTIVNGGSSG
ncbi:MAG: DinB family protein [Acidobacteria bacterium]|nr:DinB family protein [Acidobacteriota bacterium]